MQAHTVLVVDDEPASVRSVARTLIGDCRVVTATAGAQALELLGTQPISVLISDQRMPGMLGTELLARTAEAHPRVIRILLTGYTDIETLVEAINAGHVYSYVTKPWEPGALRLIVRRALERVDVEGDRRRLLGELQETCAQLQRESERKARLLALAAHELRTPIHLLSSALELVRALPDTASAVWWETADSAVEWLGRCVRQLHVAVRWESGQPALKIERICVRSLVSDLQEQFAPIAARRQLELVAEVAADLPSLSGDRAWIVHALSCLLSNAVRFTPDGGRVGLAARAHEGMTVLTVSDTGIGIAPEVLPFVFEAFSPACGDVALHSSGAFEFGTRGLGLGLSTAKAIVARHAGEIHVESVLGQGSSFAVRLP